MADEFPNEGQLAHRNREEGDRWRCSLCNGYVRGNAPMCKHCHAHFGAPEPMPHEVAAETSEPSEPLTVREKVAACFALAFTVVVGVGCYMLANRIGGASGIVTGWMLAPLLLTLTWTIIPFSFGDMFDKGPKESVTFLLLLWLMLTLLVLPIMVSKLIEISISDWWGQPLAVGIAITLYTLLGLGFIRTRWFKHDASEADKRKLSPLAILGDWRRMMLVIVLPYTALVFIAERYNNEGVYVVGFPFFMLSLHTGFRNWLWTQGKTLWQRITARS